MNAMEPPEIRVSRYEHSVAIKWPDDDNWYRFEPDDMKYSIGGAERFKIASNAFENIPNEEWIEPFVDPRPDLRRWTEPMRNQLRTALRMLDNAEQHPWSG
jgi:hypothetical protein